MELDDLHSSIFGNYSEKNKVHTIENAVQSMAISTEAEMEDDSFACGDHSSLINVQNMNTSEQSQIPELNESAKAFLQFQKEREDLTFSRTCLFCKKNFTGNRSLLLEHFTEQHNFFMGQPDNLVYINEFLNILENMLNKLQCIYCEKLFKDWSALKEHMRKKLHKRINPDNTIFDKFYMSNYLHQFNTMDFAYHDAGEEREIEVGPKDDNILCLFCDCKFSEFDVIMKHLKAVHGFDFKYLKKMGNLTFYQQVKLINYIRHKVSILECTVCDVKFQSKQALVNHMHRNRHINLIPFQGNWDHPEYYFSTLDTDYLLCGLEDEDADNSDNDSTVYVIPEEVKIPKSSVLIDENIRKELM